MNVVAAGFFNINVFARMERGEGDGRVPVVGSGDAHGVDGRVVDKPAEIFKTTGGWFGNVGLVTDLVPRAPFDPRRAVAMVCGPEVMMRHTVAALQKRGVADSRIYVSMERNMKCAIGQCGHCQLSTDFVCRDGPVATYAHLNRLMTLREL